MNRLPCLLLACSLCSCSWAIVKSPPVRGTIASGAGTVRGGVVECTSAYGAPSLDAVFAAMFGAGAAILVALAAYNKEDGDQTTGFIAGGSAYGVISLGFGMSAVSGYRDVKQCRKLKSN